MALVGNVWLFGPVLFVFMYFYSWREKTVMLVFRSNWTVQTSTFTTRKTVHGAKQRGSYTSDFHALLCCKYEYVLQ